LWNKHIQTVQIQQNKLCILYFGLNPAQETVYLKTIQKITPMDVSVSGTIDEETYPKKFRGGFSRLSPPWIRLWSLLSVLISILQFCENDVCFYVCFLLLYLNKDWGYVILREIDFLLKICCRFLAYTHRGKYILVYSHLQFKLYSFETRTHQKNSLGKVRVTWIHVHLGWHCTGRHYGAVNCT